MAAVDDRRGDVRKLARFFETLSASSSSSSKDTRKPFSSETSNGMGCAGDSGPYTPLSRVPYTPLSPVDFNGAPMRPLSGPNYNGPYPPLSPFDFSGALVTGGDVPMYNKGYHVNSKQKFGGESVVGGDAPLFTSLSWPTFNHVNSKQTDDAYTPDDGSVDADEDERPCVPCNVCSKEHPPYSACPYLPCNVCYKVHFPASCPYFNYLPQGATFDPAYEIVCGCGNEFNEEKWVCTCCHVPRPVLTLKHCSICNSSKDHSSHECPNDEVRAANYKFNRDLLLAVGAQNIPYHQVYIPE